MRHLTYRNDKKSCTKNVHDYMTTMPCPFTLCLLYVKCEYIYMKIRF